MHLPQDVLFCIAQLETAGFAAYAVGGCVRDSLLGRTPHDYDLCTAATPEEICQIFADFPLVKAGQKHGTIGVVLDHHVYEITTFRAEDTYSDNRHPDAVRFVDAVELDLARRDFTVNAMAFSPTRGLCDPFGGQADLRDHILRAVGDPAQRFREDSLRILRGVRFAVRFSLIPEAATLQAMFSLAPLMDNLARERVFDELCKLLPLANAEDLCRFAPILTQPLPELAEAIGFQQHSCHHTYDVYTHTAHVVAGVPADLPLRWAALLHDVGKPATFTLDATGQGHFYGHADQSSQMADGILRRLKAPNILREQVVALVKLHMLLIVPERKTVRRWMSRLQRDGIELEMLLQLQTADMGSKGTGKESDLTRLQQVRTLSQEIRSEEACISLRDLAINGHDLMALGYSGPIIGILLNRLLEQVIDEQLPNEKQALSDAVTHIEISHHGGTIK